MNMRIAAAQGMHAASSEQGPQPVSQEATHRLGCGGGQGNDWHVGKLLLQDAWSATNAAEVQARDGQE